MNVAQSEALLPLVRGTGEILIIERTRRRDSHSGYRGGRHVSGRIRVGIVDRISGKEVVPIVEVMIEPQIGGMRKLGLRGTGNELASDGARGGG